MTGGPPQAGKLRSISPMMNEIIEADMDKFAFLFFTCAAILTPFPMTIPGRSLSALLALFFGEESCPHGLLLSTGK
jgi:hypothetical protein